MTTRKLLITPRCIAGVEDYVVSLWTTAEEREVRLQPISRSKMVFLPADSPLLANRIDETSWWYEGEDAIALYEDAVISMGAERIADDPVETEYERVRHEYPEAKLKPFAELSRDEKLRQKELYLEMSAQFDVIGKAIQEGSPLPLPIKR